MESHGAASILLDLASMSASTFYARSTRRASRSSQRTPTSWRGWQINIAATEGAKAAYPEA